jgi:hypothetical protein
MKVHLIKKQTVEDFITKMPEAEVLSDYGFSS